MKTVAILILATLFYMTISAQDTKQTIDKLSKDPKTADHAAKADVYIVEHKKVISDTNSKATPKAIVRKKRKSWKRS